MKTLHVGLEERSYPIHIGKGCLKTVGLKLAEMQIANKYCIVTDDKVEGLYGNTLMQILKEAGISAEIISFSNGEQNKNLATVADLASKMAILKFDRKDAVIALGGGVPGDIAGFLASSYMRGIPFVQIPTTLLAQVDSSVGGKTGVDIPEGKNLVGAFYQPKAVFIDTDVLATLEEKEVLGGLAEVIKYGVIRDSAFLNYLDENRKNVLEKNSSILSEVIYTCCKIKAEVVAEDEKEADIRRILNYGHTIGHAVEAASKFTLIHGLAVSIGMVAVNKIAVEMGLLQQQESDAILELLKAYGLPTEIPAELDRKEIEGFLLTDKKTVGGKVFFVLPVSGGKIKISADVPREAVLRAIA